MHNGANEAKRPDPDSLLVKIAEYVKTCEIDSPVAQETAELCLMDSLGCALLALNHAACRRMLGPIVPGATMQNGARVPGTGYCLDPLMAAFNIGSMIRWLDFNDTWLAAEWGHPSDNLGGILAMADYISRSNLDAGSAPLRVSDVLTAMIKAHEIQGVIALQNSFNRVGLDHVLLVRIATTAVVTGMLGGTHKQIINAVSNAWLDGGALRAYRHAPNTGSRKSWAAGDATSRGVYHALIAMRGEMGYPSVLSARKWGFYDVLFDGKAFTFSQGFASYVMENVLFKISFPAEFHAQTAVEAALTLHETVAGRLDDIDRIVIQTQEAAMRIINKTGTLNNPADRDHCIQYMVAIALIFGRLTANDYEDNIASDSRVDTLRKKMHVTENRQFSIDYMDADKRSIGNAVQVFFRDGTCTQNITVEYPLGHRRRRAEGIPVLKRKFSENIASRLPGEQCEAILDTFSEASGLRDTDVNEFLNLWVVRG